MPSPSRHCTISIVSEPIASLLVGVQSGNVVLAGELDKDIRQLSDAYRQSPTDRKKLRGEFLKRLNNEVKVRSIQLGHRPKFRLENKHHDRRARLRSLPYRQMVAQPQIPLEPNKLNSISRHSSKPYAQVFSGRIADAPCSVIVIPPKGYSGAMTEHDQAA